MHSTSKSGNKTHLIGGKPNTRKMRVVKRTNDNQEYYWYAVR